MRRGTVVELAFALSGLVVASPGLGQSETPHFFTQTHGGLGVPNDPRFTEMVSVNILAMAECTEAIGGFMPGLTGAQAAEAVAAQVLGRGLGSDRIAIRLDGFGLGHNRYSRRQACPAPSDCTNKPTDPETACHPRNAAGCYRNVVPLLFHEDDAMLDTGPCWYWITPWMSGGVAAAQDWMRDFVGRYNALGVPQPARFHFDLEADVSPLDPVVLPEIFAALQQDSSSRWDGEALLGHGETLRDLVLRSPPPSAWQAFYRWHREKLSFQTIAGALRAAVVDVVREPLPGSHDPAWLSTLVSNFGYAGTDGGVTSESPPFGKRQIVDSGSSGPGSSRFPSGWAPRLAFSFANHLDLHAPVFYGADETHIVEALDGEIPDPLPADRMYQARINASVREARDDLDSIGHSVGWQHITPWFGTGDDSWNPKVYTIEFMRPHLALFRAKGLTEILLYNNNPPHHSDPVAHPPPDWNGLRSAVNQVWAWRVAGLENDESAVRIVSGQLQPAGPAEPAGVRQSIYYARYDARTVKAELQLQDGEPVRVAGIEADFSLASSTAGLRYCDTLELHVETRGSRGGTGEILVQAYRPQVEWVSLGTFAIDPQRTIVHAPVNLAQRFLSDAAQLTVRVLHVAGGAEEYEVRTDLIQVVSSENATCRADWNRNGILSVQDLFEFLAGHGEGDCRADFNCSGHLSVQDIFDYVGVYTSQCH